MQNQLSQKETENLRKKLMMEEKNLQAKIAHLKTGDPYNDPDHANDNAAIDSDVRDEWNHETIEAQSKTMEKRLANIQFAYKKMEKGTYGLCESCEKAIAMARMELVPEAKYCIDCEKRLVK